MGLLSRLRMTLDTLAKSILAPAEDPRQAGGAAYERHLDLLQQIRLAQTQVSGAKRRLQSSAGRLRAKLPRLEAQARTALQGGDEGAARQFLHQRQASVVEIESLQRRAKDLADEESRLALAERQLAARLDAFQTERAAEVARYEARLRLGEALEQVSENLGNLGLALPGSLEAPSFADEDAFALDRLNGLLEATGLDAVEAAVQQFEAEQQVEEQIRAFKADLANPTPGATPHDRRIQAEP
jgi:phage shock protein A